MDTVVDLASNSNFIDNCFSEDLLCPPILNKKVLREKNKEDPSYKFKIEYKDEIFEVNISKLLNRKQRLQAESLAL